MAGDFSERILRVLMALNRGEIVTYGEVAAEAGNPGAARAVGTFLRRTEGVPWWRVVNASGRLVPGNEQAQRALLAREGIVVRGTRIQGWAARGRTRSTTRPGR